MAPLKLKGDLAELRVAADLRAQGFLVAFPYGEDSDYDLVVDRAGRLERVQVKYANSDDGVIAVQCCSHSLTNGRIRSTKHYTAETIEWLAVYDAHSDRCLYIPAAELGSGMNSFTIRLTPARNNQRRGIRMAEAYARLPADEAELDSGCPPTKESPS